MKREEAVKLLKIALSKHEEGFIDSIDLANPNHNAEGYQLQIRASKYHSIDDLKSLLAKYGVTAREENGLLIIF